MRISGQRLAVIDLGGTACGDRHGFLCHRQGALDIGDQIALRYIFTLCIFDHSIFCRIIGAAYTHLTAFHNCGFNAVAFRKFGIVIAVIGQGCAVINLCIGGCGDRQVLLCNFQSTVRVSNIIVRGDIFTRGVDDLRLSRDVIGSALHCLAAGNGHGFDPVTRGEFGTVIAVIGQLGTVIDLRIAVRGNGDSLLSHFQSAIRINNRIACGHIFTRGVDDFRIGRDIIDAADICLAARNLDRFDAVAFRQSCTAVSLFRQRSAVIFLFSVIGSNGNGLFSHTQRTVLVGDRIACGNVFTVSVDDLRGRGDILRSTDYGLGTGNGNCFESVAGGQLCAGIAVLRQRRAVIDLPRAVCGDGDLLRRHFQCAVRVSDVVARGHILLIGIEDLRVRGDILRSTDYSLLAVHNNFIEAVTGGELFFAAVMAVAQRGAVIHLLITCGSDGDRFLCDFQRAIRITDVVAGGHIFTRFIDDFRAGCGIRAGTVHSPFAGQNNRLDLVAFTKFIVSPGVDLQRSTVIFLFAAVGSDGDLLRRHFQFAVCIGDYIACGNVITVSVYDLRSRRDVIRFTFDGL